VLLVFDGGGLAVAARGARQAAWLTGPMKL
jgi:hypothetical protein